ncbi:MAG: Na(+)-translocating NADH-quinone reductase subunit A [Saprospiraceae bacterium]|nr:Na(+)-translocating NADH-quinone reductase subunit A [Saprospiraceae bacterium]MDP4820003.1 Na(+)-translocating NADH-quinone reductase subunit A [Saprospiraceae bacterium]MDP4998453.1 Na(+)-translocating NADH-quinone reductase subunit A [Saprospiraceae bacterium]
MKNIIAKTLLVVAFQVAILSSSMAQSTGGSAGSSYLLYGLLAVAVLVFFFILVQLSDNLIAIEAKKAGISEDGLNLGLIPGAREIVGSKKVGYVGAGTPVIGLKKGFDILLEGEAAKTCDEGVVVNTFAVQPPNFRGVLPIPKLMVEEGAEVKAGDVLFFDKNQPDVKYVAPVSGEIAEIRRGEKRAITEVIILADKAMKYRDMPAPDLAQADRATLRSFLMESGAWPLINQRPYDVVPDASKDPRNIFVSTFDTAPLAPDLNFVVAGQEEAFQKGLDVLAKMTDGNVYLGLDARGAQAPAAAFTQASGVVKKWFSGKHPVGNVGVQIHHTFPIVNDDVVWTVHVQTVITIGRLFLEGRFCADRIVAVTGAEVREPRYVKTYLGANIGELLKDGLSGDAVRIISGDVLSGARKEVKDFLNAQDDQVTVVREGDYYEMFGWLIPGSPRPSLSRTYPNFVFPDARFKADTNTHGEQRAFVVTGQYEDVLPMDIYPQQLMKSILVNDVERMEALGIKELSEEDIAICEFVCTSKQPLQQILREGLDEMLAQG